MKKSCDNCVYYVEKMCRRYPPTATVFVHEARHPLTGQVGVQQQTVGAFPPVAPDAWCGEWSLGKQIALQ